MSEPIDPRVIELAGRVSDLARAGRTDELFAYVDAGVPVDLPDDKGDTLLIHQMALAAAVFRQSEATVCSLLDAGTDPDAGGPSACATADFFELPTMASLLSGAAA